MAPPPGQGQQDGRARADAAHRTDPPPPESPVWLPSLAQPRSAGAQAQAQQARSPGAAYTVPRAKNLASSSTHRNNDPAGLYSVNTLPQLDALQLPTLRRKKVKRIKHSDN